MKKEKNHLVVGLTGGIASGKTTVAKEFARLGAKIVEADKISRQLFKPGQTTWKKVIKAFGKTILKKNKVIDRKKLSRIVFEDLKKRKKLEKITHSEIISEIKKRVNALYKDKRVIVIDAPLLFEARLNSLMDKIIVVWCLQYEQIKRLKSRDKVQSDFALKQIKSQISLNKKKNMADYVILNSSRGEKANLKRQVFNLWKELTKSFK
ncbi:dephospho-CoA kinase [Elusimicrobiota bacterium]